MDKKLLLEALRKDLAATKNIHILVSDQIQREEEAYWSLGFEPWIDSGKERAIKSQCESLISANEDLMQSWFDAQE